MTLEVSTIQLVQLKLSLRMTPWTHFFCKPLDTFFCKPLDTFFCNLWISSVEIHKLTLEVSTIQLVQLKLSLRMTPWTHFFCKPLDTLEKRVQRFAEKRVQRFAEKMCPGEPRKTCPEVCRKTCPEVCRKNVSRVSPYTTDALIYLLDNIYIRFGSKLYRQTVGIPMATNCVPLLLICFCSSMTS